MKKIKTFEIVSWKKSRNERGTRLQLVNHQAVFAYEHGISFEYDETKEYLSVRIEKYSDKTEYKNGKFKKTGKDVTHVEKCIITGKKEHIKEMQHFSGYNSIGLRNELNPLAETIEELSSEIRSLKYEIQELHEQLKSQKETENIL